MATTPAPEPLPLEQELELRLAEARGQLSGNDERVGGFLREHLPELAFHTAQSLAQGAGVSPAAVVRFARRLGYASFRELRDRARAELRAGHAPELASATTGESTLQRKVHSDIANLELLRQSLEAPLDEAAALIARSRHTWFLANRETYGLVVYAYRLLHQAVPDVHLVDSSYPDPLRNLTDQDAIVVCTFRPYARQTIDLLTYARSAGAGVILLTDGLGHDFIEPGDIALAIPVESPTLFLSFTAVLCVLEALAASVATLDADRTYDTLDVTAAFSDVQGLTLERSPHSRRRSRRRRPRSPAAPEG